MNESFNLTKSYKSINKHHEHVANQRTYNYKKKQYEKKKNYTRNQINRDNLLNNCDIQILNNNDNIDKHLSYQTEAEKFIIKTKHFHHIMFFNNCNRSLNRDGLIELCEAVKGESICGCCDKDIMLKICRILSLDIHRASCYGCSCCDANFGDANFGDANFGDAKINCKKYKNEI